MRGFFMRVIRIMFRLLAAVLILLLIAFTVEAWLDRDIPAATLEARYAAPSSKFLNVDGVRIHYRDEGRGPPVVLIHANFGSLLSWDPWVKVLAANHRVLRFDMPGHGLTGPDPGGDYRLERTVALTERFVDALDLRQFPDRVEKLILLSPGALEGRSMQRAGRTLPAAANILAIITPRALAEYMLKSRFGDPSKVTPAMVDQWHDMWLREGQRTAILARLRSYSSADIVQATAGVKAPTLILWGAANPQAPPEQAIELAGMLTQAPWKKVVTYPGVGHMALEEAGAMIVPDVAAFLGGRAGNPS
jgi:pimeloyl-ACP methyl ester carboxylesterase